MKACELTQSDCEGKIFDSAERAPEVYFFLLPATTGRPSLLPLPFRPVLSPELLYYHHYLHHHRHYHAPLLEIADRLEVMMPGRKS